MTPARRGLAVALLVAAAGPLAAQGGKPVGDAKVFDKLVVDTLRDVHNKGADLYNTARDFPAAYRLYQGSLVTVRPLLGHRPEAQKFIDDGLAASEKESDPARKAFALHEAIEKVRAYLKTAPAIEPPPPVKPKVDDTKKSEEPKKTPPTTKTDDAKKPKGDDTKKTPPSTKTDDTKKPTPPVTKPVEPKKPADPLAVLPKPKGNDPVNPKPAADPGIKGLVTLKGKPVAEADVAIVSLKLPVPRVFTATSASDGTFQIKDAVPAGEYAATVTGKGVPEKYGTTTTSGLRVEVKAGATDVRLELK